VISHFTNDSAARAAGAAIGDIVVTVDGEDVGKRLRRYERYLSASTPQALRRTAARQFLNGSEGSIMRLTVRGAGGKVKRLQLPRRAEYRAALAPGEGRTGEMISILPGNVGYADLARLPVALVDSMFERLKHTRGIIFDMRGYPQGTAWPIAPRLTRRARVAAALFRRPVPDRPRRTVGPIVVRSQQLEFVQHLDPTTKWRYTRPTVMLIDERTQSQAEHSGLFFEAANGTRFVGTASAGANGDVSNFFVPGNIRISFSGHDVRHADGRQLQRVGLQPAVRVAPSIRGLRAGRDEVLERALEILRVKPRPE
jgi:C-terminal processing protease CtpA/Prc